MFTMNDKNEPPDVVYKKGHTRKVRPGTRDLSHGTFHLGSFYVGCGTWDPGPYMWDPIPLCGMRDSF